MARNTRLATTVTARYTPSVGAVDSFYLDGRIAGQREEQFADITLDREDRGSFFAVYASSHGSRSAAHNDDGNRQFLDQITNDLKKNNRRNIDYEINELAECVVNVSGRLTLADAAIRQPYFSGVIIKDGEMAAITLGRGCAYLYRDEALYPLTQDEFQLEAIDANGHKVSNMNDFAAGIAGTIRYSNIAQLKQDDCIIMCNKEVMEAIGQNQMLRILDAAEDQCEAAGMVMDIAASENPHISMQFMIGFVEDIVTVDRLGRGTLAKGFTTRTTDRTGNKNTAALFSAFDDPYKSAPEPPMPAKASVDDDLADTKPAVFANDLAGTEELADTQLFHSFEQEEQALETFENNYNDFDQFTETAPETLDYQGFGQDDQAFPAAPIYAIDQDDDYVDQPLDFDDAAWDGEASVAFADRFSDDDDKKKKIAVVALAAVAIILLFFIVHSLVTGDEGKETTNPPEQTPVMTTLDTDETPVETPSDTPLETPSQSMSETPSETPVETTLAPTDPPTDPPTDAPTDAPTEAPTNPPTDPPTEAPTEAPTQAPTDPPAPTIPATYEVQEGDLLYSIAERFYGDPSYVNAIVELNNLTIDANGGVNIQVGQVLNLPPLN